MANTTIYIYTKKEFRTNTDNTGTTLRISLKMFNGNNLPHELLLTIRQKNKSKKCFQ